MTVRVGINGYGRVGRCVLRAQRSGHAEEGCEVVAINSPGTVEQKVYMTKNDTTFRRWTGHTVEAVGESLLLDGEEIQTFGHKDPADVPWGDLGVDIVFECSSHFRNSEQCGRHLEGGAGKVLISAPAKGKVDATVVDGVNMDILRRGMHVVSKSSCTTGALAPMIKVIDDAFGLDRALFTSIHSYTESQNLLDGRKSDPRRGRSARNIVPTATGAAAGIGIVLPELAQSVRGTAVRVPTPNVSLLDVTLLLDRMVSKRDIIEAMAAAAEGPMKGILLVHNEQLVSGDYIGCPFSSIFDATTMLEVGGDFVKLFHWYDNEYGYACGLWRAANAWMTAPE